MLKYRLLHPDAPKTEYLRQKNETDKEKVIRCIRLKHSEVQENSKIEAVEANNKTAIEGITFKFIKL